jgi:hypothetical protein
VSEVGDLAKRTIKTEELTIVGLLRRIRLLRLLLLLLLVLVADTKVLELLGDLLEERHDGCDFEMRNTKSLERVRVMRGKGKRRGR